MFLPVCPAQVPPVSPTEPKSFFHIGIELMATGQIHGTLWDLAMRKACLDPGTESSLVLGCHG